MFAGSIVKLATKSSRL